MPARLVLPAPLPVSELEARYRGACDPVTRSHYQIVWLLANGEPTATVARVTGYSVNWVREVARRCRTEGSAGLGDRRHANPGGPPLLSPAQQEELRAALASPAPEGGLWTCRKVADWIGTTISRPVAEVRGGEYLRRLGFSPQRPRPRESRSDPAAQAAFKRRAPSHRRCRRPRPPGRPGNDLGHRRASPRLTPHR
jgi:transposase